MIRLVRNELFKIFHKKGIYIIFIISLALTGLVSVLMNMDMPDPLDKQMYNMNVNTVSQYEAGGIELDDYYVQAKTTVTLYDLRHEKKEYNDYYSPEYYYLSTTIQGLYNTYYNTLYIQKDEAQAKVQKQLIDESIENLHNFDWRKNIEEELKKAEEEKKECTKNESCTYNIDEQIRVLKYRLDNNIPYSYKDSSFMLVSYLSDLGSYEDAEKDESKLKTRVELNEKRQYEESVAKTKYKLDNNLIKESTPSISAASTFVSDMCAVSMIIVICIVLVSSAVVADEFNKGTIKQLLIRPYSRIKIIVSKLIATFITVSLFIVLLSIGETIVVGAITGSFDTLFQPYLLYSFDTHSVVVSNVLCAGFLKFACVLPEIMILILLTFFVSILFTNNGISTAIGVITFFASTILTAFINLHVAISYIPLVNWDFNEYLFGALPGGKYLTLTKSLVVSITTVLVLFILTLVLYKKKDIKNQ